MHTALNSPPSPITELMSEIRLRLDSEMDTDEHLRCLEQELAENRQQNAVISQALQTIMLKLGASPPVDPTTQITPQNRNSGSLDPLPGCSWVVPATPADYDGEGEKGCAFLNSCSLYYVICRNRFTDNQAHIHWAFSPTSSPAVISTL